MADGTKIEWTDATWNPVTGCSVVSPGCTNCYAMRLAGTRLRHIASRAGLTRDTKAGPVWTGEVRFNEKDLTQPLRWREPRMVFVCAHGDLFHESVPDEWIDRVFAVMALAPQHTFQVLTKRARRMRAYVEALVEDQQGFRMEAICDAAVKLTGSPCAAHVEDVLMPLPNVWLGVSVEDQARADERIPDLLATPAAVRWVSAEPLLGPVDFARVGNIDTVKSAMPDALRRAQKDRPLRGDGSISGSQIDSIASPHSSILYFQTPDHMGGFTVTSPREWPHLDWIVVGGESGPGARPMQVGWARAIVEQCKASGTKCFMKQLGADPVWEDGAFLNLRDSKGGDPSEWPADLRIQQLPGRSVGDIRRARAALEGE